MFDTADLQGAKAGPVFDAVVERLHDELGKVAGIMHAAAGHLVSLAATALAHDLWDISGVHSPEQWLGWQCGISAGRARQIIAVARRTAELPECMAALEAGAISLDHAAVMSRHVPAWADKAATELAKSATVNQLSRVVRAYAFDSAERGTDPDATVNRHVRFGAVDENHWRMVVETSACTTSDDSASQATPTNPAVSPSPTPTADASPASAERDRRNGHCPTPPTDSTSPATPGSRRSANASTTGASTSADHRPRNRRPQPKANANGFGEHSAPTRATVFPRRGRRRCARRRCHPIVAAAVV